VFFVRARPQELIAGEDEFRRFTFSGALGINSRLCAGLQALQSDSYTQAKQK